MGQKVHPVGFRLGTTSYHLSQWFAVTKNYSKYLFEDHFLRKTLFQRYPNAGFEKIEIFRKIEDHLEIRIHCLQPSLLVGNNPTKFQKEIKQILNQYKPSKRKVVLYVLESSDTSASAIADFLIDLLEKRVPYRKALKKLTFKKLQKGFGFKVQISGRLNGAEIARRHWFMSRNEKLPLQTLDANIDYCFKQALTIYGLLGIKVWVLRPKVQLKYKMENFHMLQPKRTKFRKMHRGRLKGSTKSCFRFGNLALQAQSPCWLTARQIEAGRRVLSRQTRRGSQIWIHPFPDKSVTFRPPETRMGSGAPKGAPEYWVAVIKPGQILYEMKIGSETLGRKALKNASSKMPIRTKILKNEKFLK